MLDHALAERPNECCGLLAGRVIEDVAEVVQCYPLVNELRSPIEFQSEPRSMFAAVKDMRPRGIEMLAIYHSHPSSEPLPSKKDLERNWAPGVMHLIVGLAESTPNVRAWWLLEEGYLAAAFEVVNELPQKTEETS